MRLFGWILDNDNGMQDTTQTTLKIAPPLNLEAEAAHILSIPCTQAMPLIWRLHRMLKKSANELPPLKLVPYFSEKPVTGGPAEGGGEAPGTRSAQVGG